MTQVNGEESHDCRKSQLCLGCATSRRGIKLIFNRGHISLTVAFKGPNVILGLYKCNYSLTRGKEPGTAAG